LRTREAARILRTEQDPERLAKQIVNMGTDTYLKARVFNQRAGLDYRQPDEKEVKEALKGQRIKGYLTKVLTKPKRRECITRSIKRNIIRGIAKREATKGSDNRFWRRNRFKSLWNNAV
jgi:hypothetical protein